MSSSHERVRRLLALAQSGLHYCRDKYDHERYQEVATIATELLAESSGQPPELLKQRWFVEGGYATPKIDVRAAVFRDDSVLLVREQSDGKWTLPGGWADVNDWPSRAVEKEIEEESGFTAKAVKLAAVLDRNKHDHPPMLYHVWKIFFVCEITGGAAAAGLETDAVDFWPLDALPELSTARVTAAQIRRLHAHHLDRGLATEFD